MLDTNVVIAASRGDNASLRARMAQCDAGDMVTSAIVLAEMLYGTTRGKPPPLAQRDALLVEVPFFTFDRSAAEASARLPHKRAGYDRLIAAHALSCGLAIVTGEEAAFRDIDGLPIENRVR